MYHRRLLLSLILVAIPASADLLQVTVSGQFGGDMPTTEITVPNTNWVITFDVDSQPTVTNSATDSFDVKVSNVVYDLNGVADTNASLPGNSVAFYGSSQAGISIKIAGDDGSALGLFILGDQLFSGSTAAPEILTGTFDPIAIGGDSFVDTTLGPIVITDLSPVPEPHTILLFGTVVSATALLLRQRRRSASLRT